jgi:hypothetical protein
MTITLANGTTLEGKGVHGRTLSYQGVQRDSLIFLFDPDQLSIAQAADVFTEENCRQITLTNESGTYLHEHYTVRMEIGQGYQDMALTGSVSGNNLDQVTYVRMAQSTATERLLQEQQRAIDYLLVAALQKEV